jgi:hypothetical protein
MPLLLSIYVLRKIELLLCVRQEELLCIRPWPSGQGGHTLLPWGRAAWVRSPPTKRAFFPPLAIKMKLSPFILIQVQNPPAPCCRSSFRCHWTLVLSDLLQPSPLPLTCSGPVRPGQAQVAGRVTCRPYDPRLLAVLNLHYVFSQHTRPSIQPFIFPPYLALCIPRY